jgi:acetyl-CoA acetyltransferase
MSGEVVIAGYAETPIDVKTGRSVYDLAGEAFAQLLEVAEIENSAIDGLSVTVPQSESPNPFYAHYVADALGLSPTWMYLSGMGGASVLSGVANAASAIRTGRCSVAVVIGADAPTTVHRSRFGAYQPEFQSPTGIGGPPGMFGLLSSRYDAQYGLDRDALAKIAVTQRGHALLNDNACPKLRKPLSRDDYYASRVIADPLRMLDCVMLCDGANAVLVTSAERAATLGLKRGARIAGYGERSNYQGAEPLADITETGFATAGPAALTEASLTPREIASFHPYDDFTIAVMLQLEQIGFCERGGGARFINDTDLSINGSLPTNTGGGQISAGQIGLGSGGTNLVEAVRQLFGDGGARQIADTRNALVTGIGVIPYGRNWTTSAALVLEKI